MENSEPNTQNTVETQKGSTPRSTHVNIDLLRKIQAHILEEPKRFWMGWWNNPSIPDLPPAPCGTTACIAGWALVLSGKKDMRMVGTEARDLLGLTWEQGDVLFHQFSWPEEFADAYEKAFERRDAMGMAKAGAERIEHFIVTGT